MSRLVAPPPRESSHWLHRMGTPWAVCRQDPLAATVTLGSPGVILVNVADILFFAPCAHAPHAFGRCFGHGCPTRRVRTGTPLATYGALGQGQLSSAHRSLHLCMTPRALCTCQSPVSSVLQHSVWALAAHLVPLPPAPFSVP